MARHKIPKRIMGTKIPKAIRKSKFVKSLFGSGTGRQIMADALVAAAGAAAAALMTEPGQKAGKDLARSAAKGGAGVRDVVEDAAGAVGGTLQGQSSREHKSGGRSH